MNENTWHPDASMSASAKRIHCDAKDCVQSAVMRIDFHLFCLDHVVAHCHERLQKCQQEVGRSLAPSSDAISRNYSFLRECTSNIAGFLIARPEMENIDRARLLDIMLWAAELDEKYDRPVSGWRLLAKGAAGS